MADTIEVLHKIHKAIKDLNRSDGNSRLSQPFDSLSTNVSAMENLKRESEKLATIIKSVDDHATSFQESFKDVADRLDNANNPVSKAFIAIGEGAKIADKALGNIVSRTIDKLNRKSERLRKEFTNIGNAIKGFKKAWYEAGSGQEKFYVVTKGIAAAMGKVVTSFFEMLPVIGKVVGSVVALGGAILKSVVGALGTAISAAAKFAKFLFTLPIGIANKASEMGGQLRQELVEVIGQAVENTKELFDQATNGGRAFVSLGNIARGSLLTFQSVQSSMTKLFGYGAAGAAKMISDMTKIISDMGQFADLFAVSVAKSPESIILITRAIRGLGASSEDISYIAREAVANGEHVYATLTRMVKASKTVSAEFGINRKLLSKNYFQLRKDITNFGHLSDIELQRVTARATQLGIEMKDLTSVFNKFSDFESAANSAALLSQAFGMNVDALQLIRAQDPMEIVEILRNSLLATGRDFSQLNRQERALFVTTSGLSAEALKTAMNMRRLGKSYAEIKEHLNNQKPEERQIRAMKDIETAVSKVQKIMDKKDFFTAFTDGLSKTILYSTSFKKVYTGINKQMEKFYEEGLKIDSKQLNKILKPFEEILKGVREAFSINNLNKTSTTIIDTLAELVEQITSKNVDFNKMKAQWGKSLEEAFSLNYILNQGKNSFIGKLALQSGKIVGLILRAFTVLGPSLIKGIGESFIKVLEFFNDPSKQLFNKDNMAIFLGFDNAADADFQSFAEELTDSIKEVRHYIFGDPKDPNQKSIFTRMHEQINNLLDIDKSSGIFVTIGEAIGKGMIAAVKAAGGFMSLLTGETPASVGMMVEQNRNNSTLKQMGVASQNILNATANQGALQGTLQATAEAYNGATEFLRDIPYDGDVVAGTLGYARDGLYGASTSYASYNPISPGASSGAFDGFIGGISGTPRYSSGGSAGLGISRLAKGSILSVGLEAFNYYDQNKRAAELLNDPRLGLSDEEKQRILQRAADAQLKQSTTTVGAGLLGGAATGAAIGSIVPGIGTLVGGLIGAAGGVISSAVANWWFETESATESVENQLAEYTNLNSRTLTQRQKSFARLNLMKDRRQVTLQEAQMYDGDPNTLSRSDFEMLLKNNIEKIDELIECFINDQQRAKPLQVSLNMDGKLIAEEVIMFASTAGANPAVGGFNRVPAEGSFVDRSTTVGV